MKTAQTFIENPTHGESLKKTMWAAHDAILQVYESNDFGSKTKEDTSPITRADLAAHHVLVNALRMLTPNFPIVSEEDPKSLTRLPIDTAYWLIDPLDGTKEFIKRSGEFTCNLALIENHMPVFGLVGIPSLHMLYTGGQGLGAYRHKREGKPQPIHCRAISDITKVFASKSHMNTETQTFIDSINGKTEILQAGSSLKFLKIAEGKADLYPRFAPTCEWDTAAAQAVLEGAGGSVTQPNGAPMQYGKADILNPFFIARGY